jgi:hypothetical protein
MVLGRITSGLGVGLLSSVALNARYFMFTSPSFKQNHSSNLSERDLPTEPRMSIYLINGLFTNLPFSARCTGMHGVYMQHHRIFIVCCKSSGLLAQQRSPDSFSSGRTTSAPLLTVIYRGEYRFSSNALLVQYLRSDLVSFPKVHGRLWMKNPHFR